MKKIFRLPALVGILTVLLPSFSLKAQVNSGNIRKTHDIEQSTNEDISRPVTGVYALELGKKNVLATYLSPLHYSGTDLGLAGTWMKVMPFNPKHSLMIFKGGVNYSRLLNPAHTASMNGLNAYFSWGMEWKTNVSGLQLSAGGAIDAKGGAYYLLRNGNNPVEALANLSFDLTGSFSYPFRIKGFPILLADRVSLPAVGAFFSPQYGETYYEIYIGNHSHLAHAGWWGNNFTIDNLLSLTLDFGRTAMTIGYRLNFYSQWANNLNTKIFTNSFVIGIIPGGIGLKNKHKNTIYAIY